MLGFAKEIISQIFTFRGNVAELQSKLSTMEEMHDLYKRNFA